VILLVGCATSKEEGEEPGSRVSLAELSEPARATVYRVTEGGQVEKITREFERGREVYDVEASVGGRHMEYLIGATDGAVLGTETQIELGELPDPVRRAAEGFYGTSSGLLVMKGVEYGETSYEIVGPKNGKRVEATFDPTGKQIE